jgi:hypothetical protein
MHELHNNIDVKRGISPAAATTDNTPFVSQILDMQGQHSAEFLILCGSLADADATFAVLAEEGENPGLSDNTPVDDRDLVGLEAQAGFDFSADNKVFSLASDRVASATSVSPSRRPTTPAMPSSPAFGSPGR